MNRINFKEISRPVHKSYFLNSEPNNNSNVDANIPASISKVIKHNFKDVKKLYKACIKNKCIRIVKLKKMILKIKKLQKVYVDLWGLHKPTYLLDKNYISQLFDKFICKLWIFLLKNKDKFFNTFKLWLLKVKVYKTRLDCL